MPTKPLTFIALLLGAPLLCASLLCPPLLHAQTATSSEPQNAAQPEQSFLLTLTLKVTDHGKATIDQTYTLAATPKSAPFVRDGDKIPITTGTEGGNTQFQYIDLGTNIDFGDVHLVGSSLAMNIKVEISSVAPDATRKDDPIIRNTRYSISPAVPIGKQIVIYSSSDAATGHKVEIQLLVQPAPSK
jgi:hypothetical protein